MQTSQTFSQRDWPGAGDIDDCWVVVSIWCANAIAPWLYLQTVPGFRAAAGDPDDGNTDGGNLNEIVRGSTKLWPQLPVKKFGGVAWLTFRDYVRKGHVANASVVSGSLPSALQYGFKGLHSVGVQWVASKSAFRIMNPLKKDRTRPDYISGPDLRKAMEAYGSGKVYAVAWPTEADAFKTHPLYIAPPAIPPDVIDLQNQVTELTQEVTALTLALEAEQTEDAAAKAAILAELDKIT